MIASLHPTLTVSMRWCASQFKARQGEIRRLEVRIRQVSGFCLLRDLRILGRYANGMMHPGHPSTARPQFRRLLVEVHCRSAYIPIRCRGNAVVLSPASGCLISSAQDTGHDGSRDIIEEDIKDVLLA